MTQLDDPYADPPKDHSVPAHSDDELRQFVLDFCDNKICVLQDVPPDLLRLVFMPLFFGTFAGWTKEEMMQIGTIYEHYSQAGPRSVNGYPMFTSFHILSASDWERAKVAITKEAERRKAIEI